MAESRDTRGIGDLRWRDRKWMQQPSTPSKGSTPPVRPSLSLPQINSLPNSQEPAKQPPVARDSVRANPPASPPRRPVPLANRGQQRQPTRRRRTSRTSNPQFTLSWPFWGKKTEVQQRKPTTTRRTPPQAPRNPTPKPQPKKDFRYFLLYGTRLMVMGIGICAIAGTVLSAWDPAKRDMAEVKSAVASQMVSASSSSPATSLSPASFTTSPKMLELKGESAALKSEFQALATQYAEMMMGVFLVDLDTHEYVDFNGTTTFAAASTIKLPILVAFFQDVDAGKIRLDELLTLKPEQIAAGSGDLQYQPPGTQFSALQTATLMMTISDNTATNMIIDRLGGIEVVNQRLKSWGLTTTELRNRLPDIEGTNTTTPRDLIEILAKVNDGDLISLRSRDRLLDIMHRTETSPLLKDGLGDGATIAHKTGTLGVMVADIGLVDMLNGKRYLIAVMVKRPFNDDRALDLITQVSSLTYRNLSQSLATPSTEPFTLPSPDPDALPATSASATANRR